MNYYTDGSANPNPGQGGFSVIQDGKPIILGSEDGQTTNNRMEGLAIYAAIQHSEGKNCVIYTDSQFWINILTSWAEKWEKRGWKKSKGEIKNLELVQKIYSAFKKSKAKLKWVKGHNNNPDNEAADFWANEARIKPEIRNFK